MLPTPLRGSHPRLCVYCFKQLYNYGNTLLEEDVAWTARKFYNHRPQRGWLHVPCMELGFFFQCAVLGGCQGVAEVPGCLENVKDLHLPKKIWERRPLWRVKTARILVFGRRGPFGCTCDCAGRLHGERGGARARLTQLMLCPPLGKYWAGNERLCYVHAWSKSEI